MSEWNSDLPAGWEVALLGDVLEICDHVRIPVNAKERESRQGPYPYYGANGQAGTIDGYLFDGDYALLAEDGGYFDNPLKSVAYRAIEKFWVNNHAHVLKPLAGMETPFVVHALNSIKWLPFVSGTTRLKLTQGKMFSVPFPVPPLAEQRRILAKIEALQERSRQAREALVEVGPLLERFRQSVLAAAFRGDHTADWRATHPNVEPASELLHRIRAERRRRWEQAELVKYEAKGQKPPKNWQDKYEEPEPVDHSELPELPEGWCWTTLGELALIDSGEAFKKMDYGTSGLRLLQIANVGFGKTLWQQRNYLPEHFAKSHGFLLLDNTDIAMALNRPILDGRLKVTRIIDDDLPAILYQRVGRLRTAVSGIVDYLFAFMRSPLMLQQVERNLQGTDQPYINTSDIPDIIVPLAPLAEQTVILTSVRRSLDVEGTIEEQRSEVLTGLDQLDQSILVKAFRGELVPQDPSDEPASMLLGRIRAQPKRQAKAPKQTSKSHQTSKLRKKSAMLEPQQMTLAEVLTPKGQRFAPEQPMTETSYDDASIDSQLPSQ